MSTLIHHFYIPQKAYLTVEKIFLIDSDVILVFEEFYLISDLNNSRVLFFSTEVSMEGLGYSKVSNNYCRYIESEFHKGINDDFIKVKRLHSVF